MSNEMTELKTFLLSQMMRLMAMQEQLDKEILGIQKRLDKLGDKNVRKD